jgi:hypothetical protein
MFRSITNSIRWYLDQRKLKENSNLNSNEFGTSRLEQKRKVYCELYGITRVEYFEVMRRLQGSRDRVLARKIVYAVKFGE